METNVFDVLKERDFVYQVSGGNEDNLKKHLSKPVTLYQGFDPSSDSLHLGNLLGIMALHHFQKHGHKVIFLLGDATGRVGDPTDKTATRTLLTRNQLDSNKKKIKTQVEKMGLLSFSGENPAIMVNNYEWLGNKTFLEDFLIGIGKSISINDLLKLKTFKNRLDQEKNLSLLEFCYPVLQAWDFMHLNQKYNCTLQVGGQDQWGNIIQGVYLIKKKLKKEAFCLTFPLLTTSSGEKMGKTTSGQLWLDSNKTTPFDFYQYLIKTPDDKVETLLKIYTFLDVSDIKNAVKNPLEAQERLAFEVTKIVHGENEAKKAREDSEISYSPSPSPSPSAEVSTSFPSYKFTEQGERLAAVLINSKSLLSFSEVKRRCSQNGIKINNDVITDPNYIVDKECLIKYGKSSFLKAIK